MQGSQGRQPSAFVCLHGGLLGGGGDKGMMLSCHLHQNLVPSILAETGSTGREGHPQGREAKAGMLVCWLASQQPPKPVSGPASSPEPGENWHS